MNKNYEFELINHVNEGLCNDQEKIDLGYIDRITDDVTHADVLVTIRDRIMYITFSSTHNKRNIFSDLFAFILTTNELSCHQYHSGFFINASILDAKVEEIIYKNQDNFDSITVVGHSKGASVGAIFANISFFKNRIKRCFFIGQPKYANRKAIEYLESGCEVESYLNSYDPIRFVSPFLCRNKYTDIGLKYHWWNIPNVLHHFPDNREGQIGYKDNISSK